jgi:1-deoxy-D-xylulose-5-phosphate synthase
MAILSRIEGPQDLKSLTHEQLAEVAQDCRDAIIQTITKTGGHLASNLGVVELTLALHRVFDFRRDRLLWDVGHQCYVHKLITGRNARFDTLRQAGGVGGFPSKTESEYDLFNVGHAPP